jgi:hypothetical protein
MSSESGVDAAWEAYRETSQRFEYFILGVSVALIAYVGKTLEPEKLGFTPYTMEVVALAVLVASVIVGFKRIEQIILAHHINVDVLRFQDKRGHLAKAFIEGKEQLVPHLGERWTLPDMKTEIDNLDTVIPLHQKHVEKINVTISRLYRWRNRLLACGFVGLFLAKVLIPYFR